MGRCKNLRALARLRIKENRLRRRAREIGISLELSLNKRLHMRQWPFAGLSKYR